MNWEAVSSLLTRASSLGRRAVWVWTQPPGVLPPSVGLAGLSTSRASCFFQVKRQCRLRAHRDEVLGERLPPGWREAWSCSPCCCSSVFL